MTAFGFVGSISFFFFFWGGCVGGKIRKRRASGSGGSGKPQNGEDGLRHQLAKASL